MVFFQLLDACLSGNGLKLVPTTHLDPIQAGAQITRGNYHWGTTPGAATGPISFGFRQSTTSNNDPTEKSTFTQFTAQEKAAAEIVMSEWAALANISFTEVNPSSTTNSATILFANYFSTTDEAQAYAYFPIAEPTGGPVRRATSGSTGRTKAQPACHSAATTS